TQSSYSIRIRTTDAGGSTFEQVFTISVTDVNRSEARREGKDATVGEDAEIGTTVGTLTSTDANSGDTFTYSLVTGTGATDNALFTISGDELQTLTALDFETQPSYSIRIRSTDAGGSSFEQVFTISVTDVN